MIDLPNIVTENWMELEDIVLELGPASDYSKLNIAFLNLYRRIRLVLGNIELFFFFQTDLPIKSCALRSFENCDF